jgi:hypothetical protein
MTIFAPKFSLESKVLIHTHSPPHLATVIGIPTFADPDMYTPAFSDGSIVEYSDQSNLLEAVPDNTSITDCSFLPHWVKGGANATLFLSDMSKPRHGKLHCNEENNWYLCPGTTSDHS